MHTPHSIEGRGLRECVTAYPSAIRCDIAISWPVQHSRLFPIGIPSGNWHTCAGGRHGYMAATNQRLLAGPSPPPAPAPRPPPRRACPPALPCCSRQPALSNERIRRGISLNDDVSLDQTVTILNH